MAVERAGSKTAWSGSAACSTPVPSTAKGIAFKDTHNTTWLIGRPGHRMPAAVRRDLLSPAALAA